MPLRCVLFSTDPATAEPICQALAEIGVEGEHCAEAVTAVEKLCRESFQIVIVDWDKQPEAGTLLAAARERKVTERPLTLAIVSQDAAVPRALRAGATSVLRKPVQLKQAIESLTRARDLLRAREAAAQAAAAGAANGAATAAAAGAGAGTVSSGASASAPSHETTLRAGEFLQSAAPATQFDTESEMQKSIDEAAAQEIDALKNLEPVASAVVQSKVVQPKPVEAPSPSLPPADEPRGLQWYLNQRAGKTPETATSAASSSAPAPPAESRATGPELLGFDQILAIAAKPAKTQETGPDAPAPDASAVDPQQDEKAAAQLFAYIAGENEPKEKKEGTRIHLGKGAILFAVALAACGIVAAPQAPWHPQMKKLWAHERQSLHAWLNPQVVTPTQAPESHENFGRAGDEYKLPAPETIPDATTDPSQIRVTPMVDPTAKKPNNGATPDPNLAPADPGTANSPDSTQTRVVPSPSSSAPGNPPLNGTGQGSPTAAPAPDNPAPNSAPTVTPSSVTPSNNPLPTASAPPVSVQPANAKPAPGTTLTPPTASGSASAPPPVAPASSDSAAGQPAPKNPPPRPAAASSGPSIPSSLKSQMASMTPDASGNKAPETALPSIEPVAVPEAAERALATDQPAPAYPASAKGQQGAVVLQVLIGRDGSVQDAKFLQGSLAFARAAIDGVQSWKFKPYIMNGRPVSVQTNLTIGFQPGH